MDYKEGSSVSSNVWILRRRRNIGGSQLCEVGLDS